MMPAVFVGHGSPMNAIEDNEFSRVWKTMAASWPRPRVVLCISAHWETRGTQLTASKQPETIHDFYGFPQALNDVIYPAPGNELLAQKTAGLLKKFNATLDFERGLDHGAWSVLRVMYPKADMPVIQLSLDATAPAARHYELAKALAPLRDEGVLILASGNIVHNLGVLQYRSLTGYDWAERIDEIVQRRIAAGDHESLIHYASLDPEIKLAIPTAEHYLPLLYTLALQRKDEPVAFFNASCVMGSLSMTCVRVG